MAEVPLALMVFIAARRLMRMSVGVVMQLEGINAPVPALWRIPRSPKACRPPPARYRHDSRAPEPDPANPPPPSRSRWGVTAPAPPRSTG